MCARHTRVPGGAGHLRLQTVSRFPVIFTTKFSAKLSTKFNSSGVPLICLTLEKKSFLV